jgi:predicted AlkP superfamily phosphohydrolase/phosphomutase
LELVFLGLDGVSPEILRKAVRERDMPNTESLMEDAFFSNMDSTIPAVTIPAWPSMFSGFDAGRFEAYHLSEPDYDSWSADFQDSSSFIGDFFWDRIDSEVALHYVPGTSPVYPVNGAMRGGFPSAVDFEFHPKDLERDMKNIDLEKAEPRSQRSKDKVQAELENFETEKKIARELMEREPDVLVSVVRVTDSAAHRAETWEQVLDVYEEVDSWIGEVKKYAEDRDANLVVASDHGFMRSKQKLSIMDLLQHKGLAELENSRTWMRRLADPLLDTGLKKYLKLVHDTLEEKTQGNLGSRSGPLAGISKSSKVVPAHFGLGKDCALRVHSEDMPHGCVPEGDVDKVAQHVVEALEDLEIGGEPAIEEVWRGSDLYSGGNPPEIVFRTRKNLMVDTSPSGKVLSKTNSFTHHETGVLFAKGPQISEDSNVEPEIFDVAPLCYALSGFNPPEDIRGTLPDELIEKTSLSEAEADIDV